MTSPARRSTARCPETCDWYYPESLSTASFSPALYDTFAIITRPGRRLSLAVRELLEA